MILSDRQREVEAMQLTPEETEKAIWNYKIWKWNHERNAEYWKALENQKPGKDDLSVRKCKD